MTASISAPAKIILFGEHAVVHGQPAIAVPVSSLRASAVIHPNTEQEPGLIIESVDLNQVIPFDIDADVVDNALSATTKLVLRGLDVAPPNVTISIQSTIPMASGLGSGAAVTTVLARAIAHACGKQVEDSELNALVYEVEKLYHGTPSGIDNTVIVYEQPVYFVRNQVMETLSIPHPFTFIVGDTGQSALTRVAVEAVDQLVTAEPERMTPVLHSIGEIAKRARALILAGDTAALGPLMNENHQLLQQLTVSSETLDILVKAALEAGALGAKLSGGGRGGNMIALVEPDAADRVREALLRAGAAQVFTATVE
jgi:mevalonate kinase